MSPTTYEILHSTKYDFLFQLILQFLLNILIIGSQILFISIIDLLVNVAQHMRCFFKTSFQCSSLSMILTSSEKTGGFSFLSIYSQPYLTFQFLPDMLPFDALLALLFVDGLFRLFILYYN